VLHLLVDNRAYGRLWAAQAVSLVGDWFTLIALGVLISRETGGSGLAVSGLLLAQLIPAVAMGPVAGVLADRFDRRWLLILTDLARAVLVLLFIPAAGAGGLFWLYVLACVHFGVSTIFEPARAALMPHLVEPQDLVAASTLSSITWSVMAAVGGIVGGAVLSAIGVRAAFLVDALTFLASGLLLASIGPPRKAEPRPAGPSARPRFVDGLRYAVAHPVTGATTLVKAINGLAVVDTFMVLYATRFFVVGENGAGSLGLFYASFGVGAVLGPVLLNALNDGTVGRMRRLIVAGSALISSGLFVLAGAPALWVACLAIVLRGMGGSANWTYSTIILQKTVPDHVRGRLFAIDFANAQLAAAVAAVLGGFGMDLIGVRPIVFLAAAVSLGSLVLWVLSLPWMERRERTSSR
jgi:MFS family permease